METKLGEIFDPVKVNRDVKTIIDLYRSKGYAKIDVDSRIDKTNPKRFDVIFEIKTNPIVYLTDINVTGTEVFSELEIKLIHYEYLRPACVDLAFLKSDAKRAFRGGSIGYVLFIHDNSIIGL